MFSAEFLLTSLIVVLIPGTGVIYTISTGLFHGWRASVAAAIGCTAGIIPHLLASILGLSFILHMSAVAFQTIKLAGVLYLLYLAWALWRDTGGMTFDSASPQHNLWQIALKAVLINILNPKLTIFFFTFLPLFITPNTTSPITELFLLSLVFMALTLAVFVLYGVLASRVRSYVMQSPKAIIWLRRSFAAMFAGLGIRLALTE
ncbi:MAG: LysE family translocator [Chloroflexi bacterium AL-W]|nr:LysE family translocator [Chloroflexi bacterium AL-N1]NOK65323.1 LysE family translocator [Chloroflexi bacterium AL-N10]NOK72412.1 LysE family translocator [Chloroflexi bacterium AL-N5]NOK79502.1 LysE family translocator [Chloroflexi bacterium AL-W]NOK87418.1 LysE family translocator [Chloroflexi bacterium AL-N15]